MPAQGTTASKKRPQEMIGKDREMAEMVQDCIASLSVYSITPWQEDTKTVSNRTVSPEEACALTLSTVNMGVSFERVVRMSLQWS